MVAVAVVPAPSKVALSGPVLPETNCRFPEKLAPLVTASDAPPAPTPLKKTLPLRLVPVPSADTLPEPPVPYPT